MEAELLQEAWNQGVQDLQPEGSVVDAIDQRDLNFDSDKYGWFFGFLDKKTYTYQIKTKNLKTGEEEVFMDYEAPEENKELSTEQQTSNQGDN